MSTNLPVELPIQLAEVFEIALPSPLPPPPSRLHARMVQQAIPETRRFTGKCVTKLALELALRLPLRDAVARAIAQLAEPGTMSVEQIDRISSIAFKLITEGLKMEDAVSVALHEPAHVKPSTPMPERLKRRLVADAVTAEKVLEHARALNASGKKMDEALLEALREVASGPISSEQAESILAGAQRLFSGGLRIAEALNVSMRRALPKLCPT